MVGQNRFLLGSPPIAPPILVWVRIPIMGMGDVRHLCYFKKIRMNRLNYLFPLLLALFVLGMSESQAITVTNLSCNGRTNPLGIATNDLSFGWTSVTNARGVVQSAYQ